MGILDSEVKLDVDKALEKVTNLADDSFESEDERQKQLTERLRVDMTSPFKLPHLIRPISFIWAMTLQTILSLITVVMAFRSTPANETSILAVMGSNTGILMTMVGFYFGSRRAEKINAQKVEAAIKIEDGKAKVELQKAKSIAATEIERAEMEVEREELKLSSEKVEARLDKREARREARRERRDKGPQ